MSPGANAFCRYFTEDMVDPIAVTAGLVQTALYLDFFYVYFTKYVPFPSMPPHLSLCLSARVPVTDMFAMAGCCKDRSSSCLHELRTPLSSLSLCPKIMYSRSRSCMLSRTLCLSHVADTSAPPAAVPHLSTIRR